MIPAEIIVVTPEKADRLQQYKHASVWCFAADYAQYLTLVSQLGDGSSIVDVGKAIDRAAKALHGDVIELDQRLASGRYLLSWAASDLAERNPLSSDLFLDLCRSVALIEAARAGGRHVVLVDDVAFGKALVRACRDSGVVARWRGSNRTASSFIAALRAHGSFIRNWFVQRKAIGTAVRGGKLSGCDVLLMTWFGTNDHAFETMDRYLGELPAWLRAEGDKFGWLGNPTAWVDPIEDIVREVRKANAREPLEFVGALQSGKALVKSYACLLQFPFAVRGKLIVKGFDVSAIARLFVRRELRSARLVFAAQYFFIADMLRCLGAAPKVLIYPYENQPWEKAMLMGFRKASPQTRLVGVQHAPFADNYLSAYPSKTQWRDGTAPDLLVTIGEAFRERLLKLGAPADRIRVGGALRFSRQLTGHGVQAARIGRLFSVLVSCSIDTREAFELAYKAAAATAGIDSVQVLVNFHPVMEEAARSDIRERIARIPAAGHVKFVEGSAQQWLGKVDAVIYNASGVSFEAAAKGVPTIYVASELTLDLDKMAGEGGLCCRNVSELRKILETLQFDGNLRAQSTQAAQSFLNRSFTMPTGKFWTDLTNEAAPRARVA